jgi:YidC/Oxa1 family membrane protein insertase
VDRNTFLAIVLSCAVMLAWMMYQSQFEPLSVPEGDRVASESQEVDLDSDMPASEPATGLQPPPARPMAPPERVIEEQVISFEKPLYIAEFTSRGAGLQRWELRGFDLGPAEDDAPIVITPVSDPIMTTLETPFTELGLGDLSEVVFEVENQDSSGVRFRYTRNGVTVRKTYTLDDDSYSFRLRLQVENASESVVSPEFRVRWPAGKRESQEFSTEAFVLINAGDVNRHPVAQLGNPGFFGSLFGGGDDADPKYVGDVEWAGVETTYFLGVLLPDNPTQAEATIFPTEGGGVTEIGFPAVKLPGGQVTEQEFRAYLGPKEIERLETLGSGTVRSIDLGWSWIEPLVLGFAWLLRALYSIIPNYGIAIILLTILVRVVTIPLTTKQMRSMERMRNLQPKIKSLQEKFSDDRQKQSEEMMKLYRTEGVNPLGGCFPMVLQLPVFIGLFYALRSSIQLRQAPFVGWINDLSAPETLFTIPGIDLPIRLLPVVMGASMVLQQKITPTTMSDPAQARMMMTIMPIMMTVLFYQFPSGLVLYWFVSNILAITHQLWIGRQMRSGA